MKKKASIFECAELSVFLHAENDQDRAYIRCPIFPTILGPSVAVQVFMREKFLCTRFQNTYIGLEDLQHFYPFSAQGVSF